MNDWGGLWMDYKRFSILDKLFSLSYKDISSHMSVSEWSHTLKSSVYSFVSLSIRFLISFFLLSHCCLFLPLSLVILNRCSSVDMMSHTLPLWFSHEQIKATLETPLVFPPFSPLSWCFQPLCLVVLLPHSLFLSYSLCFLFLFSACQALGLYCKYTYLQCHSLVVLQQMSLPNASSILTFVSSLIHQLIFHTPSLHLCIHELHPSGSGFGFTLISLVIYACVNVWMYDYQSKDILAGFHFSNGHLKVEVIMFIIFT